MVRLEVLRRCLLFPATTNTLLLTRKPKLAEIWPSPTSFSTLLDTWTSMAIPATLMHAPPTPCSARDASSMAVLGARPNPAVERPKTRRPMVKVTGRPKRDARRLAGELEMRTVRGYSEQAKPTPASLIPKCWRA